MTTLQFEGRCLTLVTEEIFKNFLIMISGRKDSLLFTSLEVVMKWKEFRVLNRSGTQKSRN